MHDNLFVCTLLHNKSDANYHMTAKQYQQNNPNITLSTKSNQTDQSTNKKERKTLIA